MKEILTPTNPKDAIGGDKMPLHLWPMTATIAGTLALLDGAMKYGRSNYREIGVRASIYYDAAVRHLTAWFEGESGDPDSGVDHLGHALACIAILVDAKAAGKLNDDRNIKGGYREMIDSLTSEVKRIKERHRDKSPKHYDINDSNRAVIEQTQYVDNAPPMFRVGNGDFNLTGSGMMCASDQTEMFNTKRDDQLYDDKHSSIAWENL